MLFAGALFLLRVGYAFAEAENDDDLMSFITLPKVRALKFNVTYHDRESVAPGYWFVAPYAIIKPEAPTQRFQECQVGPYIYDADGILIWAGSCMFNNRNVFDFKAANNIDGSPHLSFILGREYQPDEEATTSQDETSDKGHGYILNQHYEEEFNVSVPPDLPSFNMHEFNVLDGGNTALACLNRPEIRNLAALDRPSETSWMVAGGLLELDTKTSEPVFEWSSFDQIDVTESVLVEPDWNLAEEKPGWDYVHVNSADKDSVGNYLLSARFTNTIYYISGHDGRVLWRLGGKLSDFSLDFQFSKQHHARFLESNETHHLLSFLNNASDERGTDEDVSSALYVQVDTTTMTAKVVKRIERPDGGLTRLRGNVQTLPNRNIFVGWSESGYHSEHTPDGQLLMEARFASSRFSTYRSYKFPFTGRPNTPPDVVASVYGANAADFTTLIHVSWNGATDIATWRFYARSAEDADAVLVGNTTKTDFETMYMADGYLDWISVEAVDGDGNVLGESEIHRTQTPNDWWLAGFHGDEQPQPDDPASIHLAKGDEQLDDMDQVHPPAEVILKASDVVGGVGALLVGILTVCSMGWLMAGVYHHMRRHRLKSCKAPADETRPISVI